MRNEILTQSGLKETLEYAPDTGLFTWRECRQRVRAGMVAGRIRGDGYRAVMIDYRLYLAHRLAWLYMHGAWPKHEIDHINGVRDDNRVANLREATAAENQQNRAKQSNNSSGFIGVCWHRRGRKWRADIGINGTRKHLGLFDTPESAHAAYLAAKAELHTFQPIVRVMK